MAGDTIPQELKKGYLKSIFMKGGKITATLEKYVLYV